MPKLDGKRHHMPRTVFTHPESRSDYRKRGKRVAAGRNACRQIGPRRELVEK
jgi:hypothetical protein